VKAGAVITEAWRRQVRRPMVVRYVGMVGVHAPMSPRPGDPTATVVEVCGK